MSREIIAIGDSVNDPSGDTLRGAFTKTNVNFDDLYARLALVESLQLPARLPTGVDVPGAPRRLVPTNGGPAAVSHSILGSVESAASIGTNATFAVCRLSASLALIVYRAGNNFPPAELEAASIANNLVAQIVKVAVDGSISFGPRKAFAPTTSSNFSAVVGGVCRLDDRRAIVTGYTISGNANAAWVIDYDPAADALSATRSVTGPSYRVGNNTHLYATSDGMLAVPENGGFDLYASALSGPSAGLVSALTSPATDLVATDFFVAVGGSVVPGVAGLRLTLCLYRIVRGFPHLVDRLVTPHAFFSGASVYGLAGDSAVVSWVPASGSRSAGLVTVANDRVSLAAWTPNGHLSNSLWGCLPISPTRFLALVQNGNTTTSPISSTAGAYVWKAIELVGGVLVERESFPVVYNAGGRTSGLYGLDVIVLSGDRALLAGVTDNGVVAVKSVRFG